MTAPSARETSPLDVLSEITANVFGESPTPTMHRSEVLRRIYASGIACEFLLLSDAPVRPGALFDATGARVAFPEEAAYSRCFVALLDPRPLAKWAHDACWAFVPADGRAEVALRPTSWPPHGEGPVRFREEPPRP